MTKSILMAASLIVSLAAFGQKVKESEVPVAVKTTFSNSHKDAKEVNWEKEGANYEAELESGKVEQSVVYDPSGNLIETEVEINVDQLPQSVKDYVAKNHKNAKIKEASKITDSKGLVSYEAEIAGKDLIFDESGKFVKEEVEKDDDKD